eukprot:1158566-Pelagomonas_calceolata.AAC.9
MEYAAVYQKAHGSPPDVLNALASVTVLSLAWAIQSAFEQCTFVKPSMDAASLLFDSDAIKCVDSLGVPFPNNPNGYALVLKSLAGQAKTTFFGGIEFNRFRRNIAAQPLTLQVQSGVNQVSASPCSSPPSRTRVSADDQMTLSRVPQGQRLLNISSLHVVLEKLRIEAVR